MEIEFQDAESNNWGGKPFIYIIMDLILFRKLFFYKWSYYASYGGILINWIQGNDNKKDLNA
jgi:hypothetical protein